METANFGGAEAKKDATVLVVDDSKLVREMVKGTLKKKYDVDEASSPSAALEYIKKKKPDLILISLQMREMDGLELFGKIKVSGNNMKEVPVIFLTSDEDIGLEDILFRAGATDYIRKPFEPRVLTARVGHIAELQKLKRRQLLERERLSAPSVIRGRKNEAMTKRLEDYQNNMINLFLDTMFDELTGTSNRHGLRMGFESMMENPQNGPYALLIAKTDNLARINEKYGHLRGDQFLLELSQILITIPDAKVFRYGGDEFTIIINGVDETKLESICDDVQRMYSVTAAAKEYEPVTISFGACFWDGTMTPGEIMSCADISLYNARKTGGHLVIYDDKWV